MEHPALRLKSFEFRREREGTWRELERLVAQVEKRGVRALGADKLARRRGGRYQLTNVTPDHFIASAGKVTVHRLIA